jgi:anti-sigma regulatory factor (Ser/Thr protein kinase)
MTLETSRLSIPAESEQAIIVRQFVRLACHRYGCDGVTEDILQVADELVANAVEHGSPEPASNIEIGIVPTQRGVRIEVHDHVHEPPDPSAAAAPEASEEMASETTSHGLQIVAELASAWGVEDEPDGKVVWAEVAATPRTSHA